MAEINRRQLRKQITDRNFGKIYLLFGDEKMYVRADTDLLVTKLMGKQPPEFNYHSFTDNYSIDDIALAAQILPFLGEYNCVKISDIDVNNLKKQEFEQLIAILDNLPDATVVIITLPTLMIDIKKPGANFSKLLACVEKNGTVCNMTRESDISLARQIVRWADSRGVKIEQADAYKLLEYAGFDLNTIKNELDKLCNYAGDRKLITGEDIEKLTPKTPEASIFQLADAVIESDATKAFGIVDALIYQKLEPVRIVNQLAVSYTDFYRVRIADECGVPLSEIASYFGYGRRQFVLTKIRGRIRGVSTDSLKDSICEITQVSGKLRSQTVVPRVLLETLVAKLLMYAKKGER